jgi:hypothetical protein
MFMNSGREYTKGEVRGNGSVLLCVFVVYICEVYCMGATRPKPAGEREAGWRGGVRAPTGGMEGGRGWGAEDMAPVRGGAVGW